MGSSASAQVQYQRCHQIINESEELCKDLGNVGMKTVTIYDTDTDTNGGVSSRDKAVTQIENEKIVEVQVSTTRMWEREYRELQMAGVKGVKGLGEKIKKLTKFVEDFAAEFTSTVETMVQELHLRDDDKTFSEASLSRRTTSFRDAVWLPESCGTPPIEFAQHSTTVRLKIHLDEDSGRQASREASNNHLVATTCVSPKLAVPLLTSIRCSGFYVTISGESYPSVLGPVVYQCSKVGRKTVFSTEVEVEALLSKLSTLLNLKPTPLTGGGPPLYGPRDVTVRSLTTGGYQITDLRNLMPVFPVANEEQTATAKHSLFLRHEVVSEFREPVACTAFAMYGLPAHRDNDAACRRLATYMLTTACREASVILQNDETLASPNVGMYEKCLRIIEIVHQKGVNVAALRHVSDLVDNNEIRELISVVCYGKAAKRVLLKTIRTLPVVVPEHVSQAAVEFLKSLQSSDQQQLRRIADEMSRRMISPVTGPAPASSQLVEFLIRDARIVLDLPGRLSYGHSAMEFKVSELQPYHIKASACCFYTPLIEECDDNFARKFMDKYKDTDRWPAAVAGGVQQLMYADSTDGNPRNDNAKTSAALLKEVVTYHRAVPSLMAVSDFFAAYQAWQLALDYAGQALRLCGSSLKELAEIEYKQGVIYSLMNNTDEAVEMLNKATDSHRLAYGDMCLQIVSCYTALASVYEGQGQPDNAEQLRALTLWIRAERYGKMHSSVSTALNNLAVNLFEQQRYEEAEPLYKLDLEISEKLLGTDHEDVATSMNNLASLYDMKGAYEKATELYLKDLDITKKKLGAGHPNTATSLNNLASSYSAQGAYQEALPLYREALNIREQHNPKGSPCVAETLNNLGSLHHKLGDLNSARSCYHRAYSIIVAPDGHHDTQRVISLISNMQALSEEMGNTEEVEKWGEQLMEYKRHDTTLHKTISEYEATRQSSTRESYKG
eukprot:TRINITY_DN795_c0_g2_i2.p1 TRINITY_DN795_c0_g2~~TRINITY_DN795_c0_g2_i2.p1  ORF type:complete len:953 (+),score=198.17 TRINITY_DN795_c0_g2_i2:1102-3960(+)